MHRKMEKVTYLTPSQLDDIEQLVRECEIADNHPTKLYWNIISDRKTELFNDFLFYIDDQLVGYLAIFSFESSHVEISGVVHPQFRGNGIAHMLFQEALHELEYRESIQYCLFVIHQSAIPARHCVQALGAEPAYSEYEMHFSRSLEPFTLFKHAELTLVQVQREALKELARLDAICFKATYEHARERLSQVIDATDRLIFVARYRNKIIGKIHIRFESNTAHIHDYCIDPVYQGQGFGEDLLKRTLNFLFTIDSVSQIRLDVTTDNSSALNIYRRCGFEITAAYDFWKYQLINQFSDEEEVADLQYH